MISEDGSTQLPDAGLSSEASSGRERPEALLGVLGAMAAWGGWFIYRTSFVLDGRRVFCLFDDAMISMAYARNLIEGFGLNWARRGAPVEGFTHPLWVALMVPVNLLPMALDRRALAVQIASLGLLMLNVVLVRRLMLRHFILPGAGHWLPACVLTAFYYPLAFWSLIGMETGLQALLTTASVLLALDIVHGHRDRHLALLLVGTLAVLLRLDMALLVLAVQVYVVANGGLRQGERQDRRGLLRYPGWLLGLLVLMLAVSAYGAFRWLYFHDLLPNTYYLKMSGIPLVARLLRGGSVLLDSWREHGPLLLLVGIGVIPQMVGGASVVRRDREWGRRLMVPSMIFALCCAYSVFVGGDAWEDDVHANRFVAFAMPMVFVLFNALANQAVAAWRARAMPASPVSGANDAKPANPPNPPNPPNAASDAGNALPVTAALTAATLAALLLANGLWLQEDAGDNWKTFAAVTRPMHADKYQEILRNLRELQKIAAPGAAVAVTWAGITAYFSDFKMIDELGYNDRHIAHGAPAAQLDEDSFENLVPGHQKWDMDYVLEQQEPDALLQIWGGRPSVVALRAHGYRRLGDLWIDPSSPRIHMPPAEPAKAGGEPAKAEDDEEPGTED